MSTYTKEMEAVLEKAQPITFEKAEELAAEFGKTPRSVIAKVKNMNLEYIPREVPRKRPLSKTKAEIVAELEKTLNVEAGEFAGLEKATSRALANFAKAL